MSDDGLHDFYEYSSRINYRIHFYREALPMFMSDLFPITCLIFYQIIIFLMPFSDEAKIGNSLACLFGSFMFLQFIKDQTPVVSRLTILNLHVFALTSLCLYTGTTTFFFRLNHSSNDLFFSPF
jgi:hypothetical protein